jgi:hypothetical protein
MKPIDLTWSQVKTLLISKNLLLQYIEDVAIYTMFAYDGPFSITTTIYKDGNPDQVDFETNYKTSANKPLYQLGQQPFASKQIGSKKLYKRVHGVKSVLIPGDNVISFTIPYAWAKINGIELVGGENLDVVSLAVLDSATGTYSTFPNAQLNQFGFQINVSKDYYQFKSEFDADLYLGMQVKITYTSLSAKSVGVNFILNELK